MSEGQLKKRMLQGMHDFSLHGPENLTNEMFEFIDEAKKELVDKLDTVITNSLLMSTDNDQEYAMKAMIVLRTLVDVYKTWTKKWFGDST